MKTKLFFAAMLTFIGLSFCMLAAKVNGQNFVRLTRATRSKPLVFPQDRCWKYNCPEKHRTGYIWCEATADNAIQKTIAKIGDGDFIHDPAPAGIKRSMIGGSGTQIIRYVGASQGTTLLTLELKSPWVTNGEVMDSYTITVISEGKYTGTYTPPVETIHKYDKPLTSKPLPNAFFVGLALTMHAYNRSESLRRLLGLCFYGTLNAIY